MKPALMHPFVDTVRQRMRTDFRLGIYVVFGGLAILILFPIAMFRFYQGFTLLAVIELGIIAFFMGTVRHAWGGGNLDRLGVVVATVVSIGGCMVTSLSPGGLFWLFPILMATAFLTRPQVSIPIYLGVVAWLLIEGSALAGTGQPLATLAAMTVNGFFATVFAQHTSERRLQLEQLATRDTLTGAENRRALEAEVEIAIAGFRRDGRPVTLALIDLDHFKMVNDRFGHDAGDRVLQDFARITQASVRRTDRLFRYGGEEFILLMPGTDELGLELAMSHLRAQLREGLRVHDEPVTVSIGGAVLRVGETRETWVGRADNALYRAKESGRNRLEIDQPEE
jgi:diguanylate cyclase (GGDEF)-like protein